MILKTFVMSSISTFRALKIRLMFVFFFSMSNDIVVVRTELIITSYVDVNTMTSSSNILSHCLSRMRSATSLKTNVSI